MKKRKKDSSMIKLKNILSSFFFLSVLFGIIGLGLLGFSEQYKEGSIGMLYGYIIVSNLIGLYIIKK